MRRYRAAPYYFGSVAIIAGLWLLLMVLWSFVAGLGPEVALVAGILGILLLHLGTDAVRRSRTSERVPDTAAEAVAQARRPSIAGEPEEGGGERPGPPGSGAVP